MEVLMFQGVQYDKTPGDMELKSGKETEEISLGRKRGMCESKRIYTTWLEGGQ